MAAPVATVFPGSAVPLAAGAEVASAAAQARQRARATGWQPAAPGARHSVVLLAGWLACHLAGCVARQGEHRLAVVVVQAETMRWHWSRPAWAVGPWAAHLRPPSGAASSRRWSRSSAQGEAAAEVVAAVEAVAMLHCQPRRPVREEEVVAAATAHSRRRWPAAREAYPGQAVKGARAGLGARSRTVRTSSSQATAGRPSGRTATPRWYPAAPGSRRRPLPGRSHRPFRRSGCRFLRRQSRRVPRRSRRSAATRLKPTLRRPTSAARSDRPGPGTSLEPSASCVPPFHAPTNLVGTVTNLPALVESGSADGRGLAHEPHDARSREFACGGGMQRAHSSSSETSIWVKACEDSCEQVFEIVVS